MQATVRVSLIVPALMCFQARLRFGHGNEDLAVKQFVTQLAVETFQKSIMDKHGEVIAIETGHPGPKSDWDKSERYKTVYQESLAAGQYPQAARRGDLGCLGVPKMPLPNKRKRGKAGEKPAELTPKQTAENQHLARQRVYVEHGVRRVKAWRILRDEFRPGIGLFPLVATVTVGLVHLARLCPG